MKVKISFVTNSSSASFVGFGISLNVRNEDLERIKNMIQESELKSMKDYEKDNLSGLISHIYPNMSLTYVYDSALIGGKYVNMDLDITKRKFHEDITKQLKELGFEEEPEIIDKTWSD